MDPSDDGISLPDDLLCSIESRHRKEKKELQSQIQAMKKAAKNDQSKKKELLTEISRLEIEMEKRHSHELASTLKDSDRSVSDVHETLGNEIGKMKISKAQKRRDKKVQQEKEREELIKLQEKENLHGPRNRETQEILKKLKQRNLSMFAIPSDGDCLFKAVSHQLLLTRQLSISADKLRKDVSNYMRENKNEFLPFMSNPDTLEMLTDDQFEIYCDKMCNTNMWGGQLEVKALSDLLKCKIVIIQTGIDSIEQGVEFSGPPIVITYHRLMYGLGEHYNSTCVLEETPDV